MMGEPGIPTTNSPPISSRHRRAAARPQSAQPEGQENHRFVCAEGFRPVRAEGASEAALIFARRLARKEYGKAGFVRSSRT
jgi:hypothetical protein